MGCCLWTDVLQLFGFACGFVNGLRFLLVGFDVALWVCFKFWVWGLVVYRLL